MSSFEWKIEGLLLKAMKAAQFKTCFSGPTFDMYGCSFFLEIYPNGTGYNKPKESGVVRVNLHLKKGQPPFEFKGQMNAVMSVSLVETNKFGYITLSIEDSYFKSGIGLGNLRLNGAQNSTIQNCQSFTVKFEMEVIQAFDSTGTDITYRFKQLDESKDPAEAQQPSQTKSIISRIEELSKQFVVMQSRMSAIESKMNEEQKTDHPKQLQNNNINANRNSVDVDGQKLKLWLEKDVKCAQYWNLFIENGIDDLQTAALLTMDTIKAIGIEKIGHQIKILHHITRLKENNEGMSYTAIL
eukprot:258443_1